MKHLVITLMFSISALSFAEDSNSSVGIKIDSSYLSGNFLLRTYSTEYFDDEFVQEAKQETFNFLKVYMEQNLDCSNVKLKLTDSRLLQLTASCNSNYNIVGDLKMSRWNHRIGKLTANAFDVEQSESEPVLRLSEEL